MYFQKAGQKECVTCEATGVYYVKVSTNQTVGKETCRILEASPFPTIDLLDYYRRTASRTNAAIRPQNDYTSLGIGLSSPK